MAVLFDDIENAFLFVSMDQQFMHNAYLCKESGEIFYTSEMGDSDELPEDIDDPEKYISIIDYDIQYEGPLIHHGNENWQNEIDATCRQLYKFINL